ncbi:hypothetical protein THASP1DRAFT_30044 [Thamnocephalis sphaerospora]|uniref:Uncharacterized protein n=1 Tax=Thamnocephalis sphaerospora TaxID=78915 RepID=A0A4P9XQ45_9FUNG|nr:hypothetical protein THASP1DRAFT_30044 [Thamnocephalis sphaerospora]|eukprot:RKP08147.1 hypothetical protein THASP1DRAFT_30044 [Thamnocephalis sphaerospora]
MTEDGISLKEQRERVTGAYLQRSISVGMVILFMYCGWITIRLMRTRPRAIASICCLLQATVGITYSLIAVSTLFPGGATCWASVWAAAVAIAVNDGCVSTVILQKAYVVHQRPRWMLVFGPLIGISIPIIAYTTVTSPAVLGPTCACGFLYPPYYLWMRFGFYFPMDVVFSIAFIRVVYRQYRDVKAKLWKRLMQDGIQVILCMATSHLICLLLVTFDVVGSFSVMVIMIDW